MPFSSLGGVRPYSREEMTQTTTRNFNKNIEKIFNDNSYKESFNQAIKGNFYFTILIFDLNLKKYQIIFSKRSNPIFKFYSLSYMY